MSAQGFVGSDVTLDGRNTLSGCTEGAPDAESCLGSNPEGMRGAQQSLPPRFNLEVGEGKDLQVNEQHLLGFGSTGCVYMGQLTLGADAQDRVVPVAVKVLSDASLNHRQLFCEAGGADSLLVDFQK
ncbi:hypothetical protein DUNSADRAFT_12389, partial [Dunaliella salina]